MHHAATGAASAKLMTSVVPSKGSAYLSMRASMINVPTTLVSTIANHKIAGASFLVKNREGSVTIPPLLVRVHWR